ncbi:MAG: ATP-binding protein [Magnetococcus sp. DMHC-8]
MLSRLRDGELALSAELVSLLLRSVDALHLFLAEARGEGAPDAALIAVLLADLHPFHHTEEGVAQRETREAIRGISASLRADLPAFVRQPDGEWVGDCYRGFDIIQLAAGAAGLTALAGYAGQVADRLIPIENGSRAITAGLAPLLEEMLACLDLLLATPGQVMPGEQWRIDQLLAALHCYPEPVAPVCGPLPSPTGLQPLGEILLEQRLVTEQDLLAGLSKQPFLGDILVRDGKLSEQDRDKALAIQQRQLSHSLREAAITVRVEVVKLNRLINLVGEITLLQDGLEQTLTRLEAQTADLDGRGSEVVRAGATLRGTQRALQELSHRGQMLTRTLQDYAVSLRMIAIGGLLHSFQRLVRDAARQTGKLVRLEVRGADIELDKNIIENLSDPFKHLLRNAIDHGIETPEQRQAVGKPSHGTIVLEAFQQGEQVCIDVRDDGRGIEVARVLASARQKKWLGETERPTDQAVFDLLFRPGFSTADAVTEWSGRGVGLDVVRQGIQAMHGAIELDSQPGQGTRFRIRLPLTLTMVDGVLVRVGAHVLVVPTQAVVVSLRPDPDGQVGDDAGSDGEWMVWGDGRLPLLRLHRLLGMAPPDGPTPMATVLVVAEAGRQAALWVEEVLDQKPLLIKNLGEHFYPIPGIMGASVLDNGRVALILDLAWLFGRG